MMHEQIVSSEDPEDYAQSFEYPDPSPAPCVIKSLHVDLNGSVWILSHDGQKIIIPQSLRKPVAKRIREAFF